MMFDGCAIRTFSEDCRDGENDCASVGERKPAQVKDLEARLAALEARIEVLERMLRRQLW